MITITCSESQEITPLQYESKVISSQQFRGDHTNEPVPFIISTAYAAYRSNELPGEDQQISFTSEKDFILNAFRDGVETFDEIA